VTRRELPAPSVEDLARYAALADEGGNDFFEQVGAAEIRALVAFARALLGRQAKHLELIRNLSQSTPLDDEVAQALAHRGVLLAEVGTLRARVAELEDDAADCEASRARLAALLKRTAIAMKGPEPETIMWDWSDLPTIAAAWKDALETARDQLDPDMDRRALAAVRQALALALPRNQEES
jgi:hypothetical protein